MAFLSTTLRGIQKSIPKIANASLLNLQPTNFASQIRNLSGASYEMIKVSTAGDGNKVGIIQLNRPKVLNALCKQLIEEVIDAAKDIQNDKSVSVIIITGSEKSFAAGADIKEMLPKTYGEVASSGFLDNWEELNVKKPIIAAVNGYAFGGGCELAMLADIIIAGENAKFGQPEITIGTIPGGGGTQRLTRAIGKSRSMLMNLTGEPINAKQAVDWGLAASVHPVDKLLDVAIDIGNKIARHSTLMAQLCKESVKNSEEMPLNQGIKVEKRLFQATFATADRKEGMSAFVEKRKPNFKGE